jgi:hypothetical protein
MNPSGYAVARGRVIDAASTQSDLGRYVNDCRAANRRAGECNGSNARLATKAGTQQYGLNLQRIYQLTLKYTFHMAGIIGRRPHN